MKLLHDWQNGNVNVKVFDEGTKTREYEGIPDPEFPETIDMKITNWCNAPCQRWCHEMSNIKGQHAEGMKLANVLASTHSGMEIAFGGGATQSYPNLEVYASYLREVMGVVPNITVNQYHLTSIPINLLNKFYGMGISFQANQALSEITYAYDNHPHVVVHMILGVHTPQDAFNIAHELNKKGHKLRLLLLGYKNWGNGKRYKSINDLAIDKCLNEWYIALSYMLKSLHIGFDNLAIEQMKLSRLFTEEGWKKFYMGNEGTFSMYIDMVKEEYASHSTSPDRYAIKPGMGIKDMFQHIKENNNVFTSKSRLD